MNKSIVIGLIVISAVAAGTLFLARRQGWLSGGATPAATGPATATPLPPVTSAGGVVADARVLPARSAALSLPGGGRVTAIEVEEGDMVEAGAVLLRLDSARQAAAVLQAEAELAAAEAALSKVQKGTDAETLAAAEAGVEVARAEQAAGDARIASARANLARVDGGSADEIAIGERRVELAKNGLWGAQSQRDSICGRVEDGFADQADCDGAKARVQQSEEEVRIAELTLATLRRGGTEDEVAAARAGVREAESARAAAAARIKQAEAELGKLRKGAEDEDLTAARARVDQASAALEQARLAMDDALLRAPFAGTVGAIEVQEGEQVAAGTPVVQLGDTSAWRIETEDLTELDIVDIETGDLVALTFDAVPGLQLPGQVTRIRSFGENRLGDITFRVTVEPEEVDPRLRWNMTASVRIGGDQ